MTNNIARALQFMRGKLMIDFKKFVDIDELHVRFELKRNKNITKTAYYVFELNEFTKPGSKKRARRRAKSK